MDTLFAPIIDIMNMSHIIMASLEFIEVINMALRREIYVTAVRQTIFNIGLIGESCYRMRVVI